MKQLLPIAAGLIFSMTIMTKAQSQSSAIDLSKATVVTPGRLRGVEAKAVQMLVVEVERRTRLRWAVRTSAPAGSGTIISVGKAAIKEPPNTGDGAAWKTPEGYRITTSKSATDPQPERPSVGSDSSDRSPANSKSDAHARVAVIGADSRGLLFGVGRLLRNLHMERDKVTVPAGLHIASKPFHHLRGHQLGYRPKTNSYDGWSLPMWEQYVRDLIVFGANAVELIPPRSDDAADSPHFPKPQMEMMTAMSGLLDSYGLDVWIWYPAMDPDYSNPHTVDAAIKEWGEVFRKLPRVDAVFVPGGDPGHTEPKYLMALLEKQSANLRRYHPKARMWVSPQGFTAAWMEQFLDILNARRPEWLGGIVFGPQVRMPLPELRKRVPAQYPIRDYPDITHSMQCQFPVENWDVAYALTEGREGINPRPVAEARICRYDQQFTVGSITYSEGCNDDVNKAVWSALEWDPNADIEETLHEYSRYFIDSRLESEFARGLSALERNWSGPLDANTGVEQTLSLFREMERAATPQNRLNWRFQQALYRAYYDAYVYRRLLHESELERRAIAALAEADTIGWREAIAKAETALADVGQPGASGIVAGSSTEGGTSGTPQPLSADAIRSRIYALAEALFQSIHMQLSVPLYAAISFDRGANLDRLDYPLNSRVWLTRQFAEIRAMPDDSARRAAIRRIVHWGDPGPGGFYDDLGDPRRRPHLIPERTFEEDPGHMYSVRMGYEQSREGRMPWGRYIETLYDTPLRMSYTGLDPNADYSLRVVYGPGSPTIKTRLTAGSEIEVHPWLAKPVPNRPLEFDIPKAATASGSLMLVWQREPGFGGNGRGCQVCEVWLLRK